MKMIMRLGVLSVVAVGTWLAPVPAANAVDVLDVRGIINVQSDFGACGTVTFQTEQRVIVGELSAEGWVQQGTSVVSIREARPVVLEKKFGFTVCFPGVGFEPTNGQVTYTLTGSGTSAESVTGKTCQVTPQTAFSCFHV